MRSLASAIVSAVLVLGLASAALAEDRLDLICRGTSTTKGFPAKRVRFHLRVDADAHTFCYGACHETLTFTSSRDGDFRYESAGREGERTLDVRFQPGITYESSDHAGCPTCVFENSTHAVGGCRRALVVKLVTDITGWPESDGPWPGPLLRTRP